MAVLAPQPGTFDSYGSVRPRMRLATPSHCALGRPLELGARLWQIVHAAHLGSVWRNPLVERPWSHGYNTVQFKSVRQIALRTRFDSV